MKLIKKFVLIILIIQSCTALKELATFTKCQFRIKSVQNVSLSGIKINSKSKIEDFSATELAQLSKNLLTKQFPMSFDVMLEIKNPNNLNATMEKMEWIIYVDNNKITEGVLDRRVSVAPGSTELVPLNFSIDLIKIANSSTVNSLINLAFALANIGDANSRLTIKIKPTIKVSNFNIVYPDYITITKEFK